MLCQLRCWPTTNWPSGGAPSSFPVICPENCYCMDMNILEVEANDLDRRLKSRSELSPGDEAPGYGPGCSGSTPAGCEGIESHYDTMQMWMAIAPATLVWRSDPAGLVMPVSMSGFWPSLHATSLCQATRPCRWQPWPRRRARLARRCTGGGRTRRAWPQLWSQAWRMAMRRPPTRPEAILSLPWWPSWRTFSGGCHGPAGCRWSAPCSKTPPKPMSSLAIAPGSSPLVATASGPSWSRRSSRG